MPDLSERIEEAAAGPAAHSVDGESATDRPIADLIAADKHLRNNAALDDDDALNVGLRFRKIKANGAT